MDRKSRWSPQFTQNSAWTVPFHKMSTPENCVKLRYFTQCMDQWANSLPFEFTFELCGAVLTDSAAVPANFFVIFWVPLNLPRQERWKESYLVSRLACCIIQPNNCFTTFWEVQRLLKLWKNPCFKNIHVSFLKAKTLSVAYLRVAAAP